MSAVNREIDSKTASEPVFVFGSNIAGRHDKGAAVFALKHHGAEPGKGSGRYGNSYAIPTQNSEMETLPLSVIASYVGSFLTYAGNQPSMRFQVTRIGCGNAGYKDADVAPLFSRAPPNCLFPGVWLRFMHAKPPVRILVLDPGLRLRDESTERQLDEYLSVNLPLWDAASVELVSVGTARSIVTMDLYARRRGYAHRILAPNTVYYHEHAEPARDAKAIWYASRLVCVTDPDQTCSGEQVRLLSMASRSGLTVEELEIAPLEATVPPAVTLRTA